MSHGTILFAALNNTIYFATVPKYFLKLEKLILTDRE